MLSPEHVDNHRCGKPNPSPDQRIPGAPEKEAASQPEAQRERAQERIWARERAQGIEQQPEASAYETAIQNYVEAGGHEKDARKVLDAELARPDPQNMPAALERRGFAKLSEGLEMAGALCAEENQKMLAGDGQGKAVQQQQPERASVATQPETPRQQAAAAMEQALERWLDGNKAGAVRSYINAADWATRHGIRGATLAAEVALEVEARRGAGAKAGLDDFLTALGHERARERGLGR